MILLAIYRLLIFFLWIVSGAFIWGRYIKGDFAARYGRFSEVPEGRARPVWIHCSSGGEVITAEPIIRKIVDHVGAENLILSGFTETGLATLRKLFPEVGRTMLFPLDFIAYVRRAFDAFDPRSVVIFETELWPNFYSEAERRGIPVVIVNGRISDTSFRYYRFARSLLKEIFHGVELFLMQSESDAQKIISLGASLRKVFIGANLKIAQAGEDRTIPKNPIFDTCKRGKLITAGSTHNGEEELIIRVFADAREKLGGALSLAIAPRHIKRVAEIELMIEGMELESVRYSEIVSEKKWDPEKICIVDRFGELMPIYAASDVVIVGGSFTPRGGHNIVEPARLGKPVVYGPYMHNFRLAKKLLETIGLGFEARNEDGLFEAILHLVVIENGFSYHHQKLMEELANNNIDIEEDFEKLKRYLAPRDHNSHNVEPARLDKKP